MFSLTLSDLEEESESRAKIKSYSENLFDFLKYTFRGYKRSNWHHELLCRYYQRAIEREINYLIPKY